MGGMRRNNQEEEHGGELELPPGFRFHPTDEELVKHYLCRKCASQPLAVPIIKEIDLYKFDPWQLPEMALYGEKEWYFFSPRDRKYPNGSRPNRAAGSGYWKATGADKHIGKPKALGIKKALVFYAGKAPKGLKTNWIMHEYRLANVDRSAAKKNHNLRLDDWVLCRIYNKKGSIEKHNVTMDRTKITKYPEILDEQKPAMTVMPPPPPQASAFPPMFSQNMDMSIEQSVPMLQQTTDYSSCSEHVLSPDVQSELNWSSDELDNSFNALDNQFINYLDGFSDIMDSFNSSDQQQPLQYHQMEQQQQQQQQQQQISPIQDMFTTFLENQF